MFYPIDSGSHIMVHGLRCYIPKPFTIYDPFSGKYVDTYNDYEKLFSETSKKTNNYTTFFRRLELPKDWSKRVKDEKEKQQYDPHYVDDSLNKIRREHWLYRLSGYWFLNDKTPTYITGLHWLYLNHWKNNSEYFKYRNPDRKYFYSLRWAIENPICRGILEITKRREGKSKRAGIFLFDEVSRNEGYSGGIQSKEEKAAESFYLRNIARPFSTLPEFFKPNVDDRKTVSNGMMFYNSFKRGSVENDTDEENSLSSQITYADKMEYAYDGEPLHAYVGDEESKAENVDIIERDEVIRMCTELDGSIIGKCVYTTTVENIKTKNSSFFDMWSQADQSKVRINDGEMTKIGLVQVFTPTRETLFYDEYGNADVDKADRYIQHEREKRKHNKSGYISYVKKNPNTADEAFLTDSSTCSFDVDRLNVSIDIANSLVEKIVVRGNFRWEEKDKKVVFEQTEYGRWLILRHFIDWNGANDVKNKRPVNGSYFFMGADPFDHILPKDEKRRSNGSCLIKCRDSDATKDEYWSGAFICMYLYRTVTPQEFYEDMIMTCFYFSVPMLFEYNKVGIRYYFEDRGYEKFLVWLPDSSQPGVYASQKSNEEMVILYHAFITKYNEKLYFKEHINQILDFDINHTKLYDAFMAGGYCLMSEDYFMKSIGIRNEDTLKNVYSNKSTVPFLRKHKIRQYA